MLRPALALAAMLLATGAAAQAVSAIHGDSLGERQDSRLVGFDGSVRAYGLTSTCANTCVSQFTTLSGLVWRSPP
jgi:hypothetical protein